MAAEDPMVMPAAQMVLTQLMTELAKTAAGQPVHARITPGTEVVASIAPPGGNAPMGTASTATLNECCEGIASVRVLRWFPSTEFPVEDPRPLLMNDGVLSWAVELELFVIRCGSQPGAGLTPTDAQLTADAQIQHDDGAAMRRVGPALMLDGLIFNCQIGSWNPAAGDGGCLGGSLQLTVQVDCAE